MIQLSLTPPNANRVQYLCAFGDIEVYADSSNRLWVRQGAYSLQLSASLAEGIHRLELQSEGIYLDGTAFAASLSWPSSGALYLGTGPTPGTEWTGGVGEYTLDPAVYRAATSKTVRTREDLLTGPRWLQRTSGTARERVFARALEQGTPGLVAAVRPTPDLDAPFTLRIDGIELPYPVTEWSLQPTEDVVVDDVGYGAVRVAWPELQASGVLSFRLEDVPAANIQSLRSLLLRPQSKRWLSFRGRRYQADEFDFSETPDSTRFGELYSVTISANVYRPYSGLPPVPGTRIWPIQSLRQMGGGARDRLLKVQVVYPLMLAWHTGGLFVWNLENGETDRLSVALEQGLAAAYWYSEPDGSPYHLMAVREAGGALALYHLRNGKFLNRRTAIPLQAPATAQVLFLGDRLLLEGAGGVYQLHLSSQSLTLQQSGARLNPTGFPLYLTDGPLLNSLYPASNIRWAVPAGQERVMVASNSGIALYSYRDTGQGYQLQTWLRSLVSDSIAHSGYLGKPGLLEGLWYVRTPQSRWQKWYPSSALPPWTNWTVDQDGDGWVDAPEVVQHAEIHHQSSDLIVHWPNLRGIASDGFAYFPYTDRLIFRVEMLL